MVRRVATLRASDEDREQVAERLRRAAADGRLVAEELEQRLATALRARTYGELDPLVADLPSTRRAVQRRPRMSPVAVVATGAVVTVTVVAFLAVAVLLLSGLFAGWAVWAFVAWCVHANRRSAGRRYSGPAQMRIAHRRSLL